MIWRSIALRLLLAAFPLWSVTAVLTFRTAWALKLAVGGLAALTLAAPAAGLCAVAVLAPLAMVLGGVLHLEGFRMAEMLVVAFLSAWLLAAGSDRSGPRVPAVMAAAGWLLALATATSIASFAWWLRESPRDLADTAARLWGAYFLFPDHIGFVDGARIVEGLALVAATLYLFRRRPSLAIWLPAALCAGGALAGLTSVLITRGIGPTILLDAYRMLGRVAHIYDVNAAGSYFAMLLCLALGMAARARKTARALWIAAAVMNGVGLWFSDSRSATAALVITAMLVVVWRLTAAWSVRTRVVAAALVIAVGLTGSFIRARLLERDPNIRGAGLRQQFYATSLRMIAARPLLGVGVGQYSRSSTLFLSPELAWFYGSENAHNYFLQVGAELGLPGLAFFALWVGAALAVMARTLTRAIDPRLLGASAGICAFLGTCLTGHPLLVGEVAFPFWILFALTLGLALTPFADVSIPAAGVRTPLLLPVTACVAAFVVLAGIAGGRAGPVQPPALQAVDGFYAWETADDGRRVRWSGQYGSVFVPADVKRVYIPVRVPADRPAIVPMPIDIRINGQRRGIVLVGSTWATLDLWMPQAPPLIPFKRIDIRADRTWQPAVYVAGSDDTRFVGVQVGECELIR